MITPLRPPLNEVGDVLVKRRRSSIAGKARSIEASITIGDARAVQPAVILAGIQCNCQANRLAWNCGLQ